MDMLVDVQKERVEGVGEVTRPRLFCSASDWRTQDTVYIDCSKRGKEYIGLETFGTYRSGSLSTHNRFFTFLPRIHSLSLILYTHTPSSTPSLNLCFFFTC